jgi:hypothetical protein
LLELLSVAIKIEGPAMNAVNAAMNNYFVGRAQVPSAAYGSSYVIAPGPGAETREAVEISGLQVNLLKEQIGNLQR